MHTFYRRQIYDLFLLFIYLFHLFIYLFFKKEFGHFYTLDWPFMQISRKFAWKIKPIFWGKHYENMPIQIYCKFSHQKLKNFR